MKVDLVMWAKNGASALPLVLARIDNVIPKEVINKKIFIDDSSTDGSAKIAIKFGWTVYNNPYGGIASGINEALKHVTAPFFASVEQDILLAKNWFIVSKYMGDPEVMVASGEKAFSNEIMQKMNEYWIEHQPESTKRKGVNIDNAFWKTDLFRQIVGNVPLYYRYGGADCYIAYMVNNSKYKSVLDTKVVSAHLRFEGLKQNIKKHYLHGLLAPKHGDLGVRTLQVFKMALFSPIRGFEVAVKKKCPQVFFHYPLLRFAFLAGMLKAKFSNV